MAEPAKEKMAAVEVIAVHSFIPRLSLVLICFNSRSGTVNDEIKWVPTTCTHWCAPLAAGSARQVRSPLALLHPWWLCLPSQLLLAQEPLPIFAWCPQPARLQEWICNAMGLGCCMETTWRVTHMVLTTFRPDRKTKCVDDAALSTHPHTLILQQGHRLCLGDEAIQVKQFIAGQVLIFYQYVHVYLQGKGRWLPFRALQWNPVADNTAKALPLVFGQDKLWREQYEEQQSKCPAT